MRRARGRCCRSSGSPPTVSAGQPLDVPAIAHRLGVAYVLDGSVRKSGNRVRVTAQLIDAADSTQLWSNTYDRELTDIFAIQDEIAGMVVRELEVTLLASAAPPRAATNLEAALASMRREPSENWRLPGLALVHHALQQEAESEATLAEAKRRFGDAMAYQIAEVHAYRGETDAAFAWLDRAYRQKDAGLAYYLVTDPLLKQVAGDARYPDLLRRMNLSERATAGPVMSD